MNKFVNFNNAASSKREKYAKIIEKIRKDKVCPFCPGNLFKYHKHPIIEENSFWIATKNMYPYKGTRKHILLIHKKHISSIGETTPEALAELQKIISSMTKRLKIKGGLFFFRFGETKFTGATVSHLHAHLIVPIQKSKIPITVKLN